jgi:hypothetical protein
VQRQRKRFPPQMGMKSQSSSLQPVTLLTEVTHVPLIKLSDVRSMQIINKNPVSEMVNMHWDVR